MSRRGPGLARLQTLMENLKREINWGGSTIGGQLEGTTLVSDHLDMTNSPSNLNLYVPLSDELIVITLPAAIDANIGWSTTVRLGQNDAGEAPSAPAALIVYGDHGDMLRGHLWNFSSAGYWYYYWYSGIKGDSGKELFIPDPGTDNAVILDGDDTGWGNGGLMKFTCIADGLFWVEGTVMSLPSYVKSYYYNAVVATPFGVYAPK